MRSSSFRLFLVVACLGIFLVASPVFAQIPFGGIVTAIQPCNSGLLVWVKTPFTGILPFMWIAGNLPFLMHVPPHPGQFLLGVAASAPAPCFIGPFIYGAGLPIIYHGSSV